VTHEEAQALWLLANDGALDADRHAVLDEHMASCAACRSEVDRLVATDRALRVWGAVAAPAARAPESTPVTPVAGRRWWPVALAAVLAGITLGGVGGFAAGRASLPRGTVAVSPPPVADGRGTFVLLLEEPGDRWPPAAPLARPAYFEWMDSLTARNQFAGGERLAEDEGAYVMPDGTTIPAGQRPGCTANFSGLFIVRAADYDEAVRIARGSPHLEFGGVLVRRVY